MFPLNWNIPFIRKNGSRTTLGAITGDIAGIEDDVDELTEKTDDLFDNVINNGAVNLLPNNAATDTINGVTFTVNDDGTVTANGTATAVAEFTISTMIPMKKGTYALSSGSNIPANVYWSIQTTTGWKDVTNGANRVVFTENSDFNIIKARLYIANGVTVSDLILYPMLTLASYDGDYVPYAMTNRELTEDVTPVNLECTLNSEYIDNGTVYATKVGNLVTMSGYFHVSQSAARNTALITLPSGIAPFAGNAYGLGITDSDTVIRLRLNNNTIVADGTNGAAAIWYNIMMSFVIK